MKVRGPNGTIVEFPDGTDAATINTVMAGVNAPKVKSDAQKRAELRSRFGNSTFSRLSAVMNDTMGMGFADEMAGAAGALASGFKPGTFDRGRDEYRSDIAKTRAEMPVSSTLASIAGFAGSLGLSIPGRVAGAAVPLLESIKRAARSGSIMGGITGAGNADGGLVERGAGAAVGAGAGAVLGGALPVAGRVLSPIGKAIASAAGRTRAPIAPRMIADALRSDGMTGRQAGRMIDDARANGTPLALADVGDNTRELAASVGRKPGPSRTIVRDMAIGRQEAQADRIAGAITRDLGTVANPRKVSEALQQKAKTEAAPFYDEAYAAPMAETDALKALLARIPGSAVQNAKRIARLEGRDPNALGVDLSDAGEIILTQKPSMQTLDYIKRGLDDVVEVSRDKTTGKLQLDTEGRATNDLLREYLGVLKKINPAYEKALETYAGPMRAASSLAKGKSLAGKNADDIEAETERMTPFELEHYRLGIRSAMTRTLGDKGDYADKVNALIGTPNKRAALQRVFGGQGDFDRFMATLAAERRAGLTYGSVNTNSKTAGRSADDAANSDQGLLDVAADVAASGVGPVSLSIAAIGKLIREARGDATSKLGEVTRGEIAAGLSETDPVRLAEAIRNARVAGVANRQTARVTSRLSDLAGRGGGVIAGQAINGRAQR